MPSPTGAGEVKGIKGIGAGNGVGASDACDVAVAVVAAVVVVVVRRGARAPDRAEYVA